MSTANRIVLAALFIVAVAAWFIFSTVVMAEAADATLTAVMALGALVITVLADVASIKKVRALDRRTVLASAAAGILMLFAAPLIVLLNRFTDAPPGTETLFFTTAAWGVLGVVGALVVRSRRPSVEQLLFSAVGLLGAAAVLANWERPSSFSPLVRYAQQEMGFLLAGVCWVVGTILLQALLRERERGGVLLVAAGSGAAAALVYALYDAGIQGFAQLKYVSTGAFALAVAFGVVFVAWSNLVSQMGMARSSALWFLPAALITMLTIYEQAVSPRGPDPVIWEGALGGVVLVVIGAVGVLYATQGQRGLHGLSSTLLLARIAGLLSAFAVVAGVISLVTPAFTATATGTLADGQAYLATWEMLGYESAGGWIPLLAGALLLTASFGVLGGPSAGRTLLVTLASGVTLVCYWFVADTPLHTWNRWIPVEIQSEYGTEYALIEFSTIHDPVRIAALLLGAAAVVVLLVLALTDRVSQRHAESAVSEVSS